MQRIINFGTRLWKGIRRVLFPGASPSLEFSQDVWDKQYSENHWAYLENISELGRYSLIAGYLGYLLPTARVLEVGCGTGLLLQRISHLPYKRYKGIDISSAAISAASQLSDDKTSFSVADGANYTDSEKYEVIIFNEALYYFRNCLSVLSHYEKMLESGGCFIVSMVVGEISEEHWRKIEKVYQTVDCVQVKNQKGITWNVRMIKI